MSWVNGLFTRQSGIVYYDISTHFDIHVSEVFWRGCSNQNCGQMYRLTKSQVWFISFETALDIKQNNYVLWSDSLAVWVYFLVKACSLKTNLVWKLSELKLRESSSPEWVHPHTYTLIKDTHIHISHVLLKVLWSGCHEKGEEHYNHIIFPLQLTLFLAPDLSYLPR